MSFTEVEEKAATEAEVAEEKEKKERKELKENSEEEEEAEVKAEEEAEAKEEAEAEVKEEKVKKDRLKVRKIQFINQEKKDMTLLVVKMNTLKVKRENNGTHMIERVEQAEEEVLLKMATAKLTGVTLMMMPRLEILKAHQRKLEKKEK